MRTNIVLVIVLFLVSISVSATDFQSLYDSAWKQQSINVATEALRVAEDADALTDQAKANYLIGFLYKNQQKYHEALNHYFSALFQYEGLKDYTQQTKLFQNIGNIYSIASFQEEALQYYQYGSELALMKGDSVLWNSIQFQIAKVFRETEDYGEAQSRYLRLLESSQDVTTPKVLSWVYLELSFIAQVHKKDWKQARVYLDKAVNVPSLEGSAAKYATFMRLNDLGYMALAQGNILDAKTILNQALTQSEGQTDHIEEVLVQIYGNLAKTYKKLGQLDSSMYMYEKSIEWQSLRSFEHSFLQTAKILHDHYKEQSPDKQAHYFDLIYQFGEELLVLKAQLAQANIEFQVRAADYRQKWVNELRASNRQRIIQYIILGIALLIIIGIVYYFMWRIEQRKRFLRGLIEDARINPL